MNADHLKKIVQNPALIDQLSPREFEELVASILEALGWQVSLTQATRDGGFDILAIQRPAPGLEASWLIECKKYAPDKRVGVEIIRQLYGVRDYLAIANAAVVTTATFTKESLEFARQRTAIKLIDRTILLTWIAQAQQTAAQVQPPGARFQSVFISYSSKDYDFASRLK